MIFHLGPRQAENQRFLVLALNRDGLGDVDLKESNNNFFSNLIRMSVFPNSIILFIHEKGLMGEDDFEIKMK